MRTPEIAVPTVPMRMSPGGLTVATGDVSVSPQPSRMPRPMPSRKAMATATERGAAPETAVVTLRKAHSRRKSRVFQSRASRARAA